MPQVSSATAAPLSSRIAIFIDFDGTLVNVAQTPDEIEVATTLPASLERAADRVDNALAVLTGREINTIDHYLAPLRLPVAGAHGSQRRRADGTLELTDPASSEAARLIAQRLEPLVAAHPRLLLEAKEGTVALHFRQAPELEGACRAAMEEAMRDVAGFALLPGKMVFEARPMGISKGTALRAFMKEQPFAGRLPVFIGDDVTDEDGFIAAQDLGGVGIKVGQGETAAQMRIADVASVHALLQGLGDRAGSTAPGMLTTE
jgi:trehalose 6-phosphate phosphatase